MIKAGISTACFFEKQPTENAIVTIKEMRCEYAEVFLTTFFEYEPKFIEQIIARKGNINIHSVHALGIQFEPQLFSNSARVRNDAELFFRKVCIAAKLMDAKYYTFHGPVYFKNKKYDVDARSFGKRMRELCMIARSYGVELAYENVHYSYFSEPKFWNDIIDYCPELYGVLDIKQAALSGHDYQKYIDVMRDRIAVVHVADLDKTNKTFLPGDGKVDFERLIKSLLKVDYDGPLLVEVYANDYKDPKQVKDGLDFLAASLIKFRSATSALRREAVKEAAEEAAKDEELLAEVMDELEKEKQAKQEKEQSEPEEPKEE